MGEKAPAFEEHGEVLAHWAEQGFSQETIVVLDHHLDLKRLSDVAVNRIKAAESPESLAGLNRRLPFSEARGTYGLDSFLYGAALRQIVSHVIWVFPERRPLSALDLRDLLWSRLEKIAGHGSEILESFRYTPDSASASILGVRFELSTLQRLHRVVPPNALVDVDLDFFFDGQPQLTHPLSEVEETFRRAKLRTALPSFAYSISSGFMPEHMRWVGDALATELGITLEARGRAPHAAPRTMDLVGAELPPMPEDIERVWTQELEALGAAGWSGAALLWANAGETARAAEAIRHAQAGDEAASWASYRLGLQAMERRQWDAAQEWLLPLTAHPADTLQVHSLALVSLVQARLGAYEAALASATRCVELAPLQDGGYRIARWAAKQLGHAVPEAIAAAEERRRVARERGSS